MVKTKIVCAECGKMKVTYKDRGKFCSKECWKKHSYKKCIQCGKVKKHEGKGMCRNCYIKLYRQMNPESHKRSDRKKYLKNKEKYKVNAKLWATNNPKSRREIISKFQKADYIKNKIKYVARHLGQKVELPYGQICQECHKNPATERHHEDYNKPLEVKFVCKACHSKIKFY